MGDYGIKVSLPGKSITSSNIEDYVLWSKYDIPKTYLVGSTSYTLTTDDTNATTGTRVDHNDFFQVNHNLGYRPYFIVFWNVGSDYGGGIWVKSVGFPNAHVFMNYHCTTTYFSITYDYTNYSDPNPQITVPITWNFKYYIFLQQA